MAGREDFGVLRSSFLTDARALRAADLYAAAELAHEDAALAMVAGHVAMLGLWAMRETDDGVLPGDGVSVARVATLMPTSLCRQVMAYLTEAGLLRPVEAGVYLVGFRDCYGSILDRREANREANRLARAEAAKARAERAEKVRARSPAKPRAERRGAVSNTSAPRGDHVSNTPAPRVADVTHPSGPTGTFVPAGTDGTERTFRSASSEPPDPPGARVAALASEADAAPRASSGASPRAAPAAPGTPPRPPQPGTPEWTAAVEAHAAARAPRTAPTPTEPQPYRPPDPAEFERRRAEQLARLGQDAAPTNEPADERDANRAAGQLVALPPGDRRHAAAVTLLAERPRGPDWLRRAAALLAPDVPQAVDVADPLAGFGDAP
jgi:hypothetical protein